MTAGGEAALILRRPAHQIPTALLSVEAVRGELDGTVVGAH
jgi:hypothetical protein